MPGALFLMRTPKPLRRLAYFPSGLEGLLRENARARSLPPVRGLESWLWSWKNGAGEGIRTLDPDLGKVVLYP
jgi:hypothetical protein